jgi:hypothetical protein
MRTSAERGRAQAAAPVVGCGKASACWAETGLDFTSIALLAPGTGESAAQAWARIMQRVPAPKRALKFGDISPAPGRLSDIRE